MDEKKQSRSAKDAEAKGRELYRAMQSNPNRDEKRDAMKRAFAAILEYGTREQLEELLRNNGYSGLAMEQLLKRFDDEVLRKR
jgi:hypothetical protein